MHPKYLQFSVLKSFLFKILQNELIKTVETVVYAGLN